MTTTVRPFYDFYLGWMRNNLRFDDQKVAQDDEEEEDSLFSPEISNQKEESVSLSIDFLLMFKMLLNIYRHASSDINELFLETKKKDIPLLIQWLKENRNNLQLQKLADLKKQGILSDEEFQKMKMDLLAKL